jgi:hypothetical protein
VRCRNHEASEFVQTLGASRRTPEGVLKEGASSPVRGRF